MCRATVARQDHHRNSGVSVLRRRLSSSRILATDRGVERFLHSKTILTCAPRLVQFDDVIADFLSTRGRLIAGMDQNVIGDLAEFAEFFGNGLFKLDALLGALLVFATPGNFGSK